MKALVLRQVDENFLFNILGSVSLLSLSLQIVNVVVASLHYFLETQTVLSR